MLPTMRPVLVFELGVSSVSGDTSNAALPCAMFLRTEIGSAVLDEDGSAVDDDCVDDAVELDVDDVDDILSTVVGIGTGELELELITIVDAIVVELELALLLVMTVEELELICVLEDAVELREDTVELIPT